VLLVLQIVPYFMTGFRVGPEVRRRSGARVQQPGVSSGAHPAGARVGILFYTTVAALVSYLRPWQGLAKERFATAVAFEQAFGSRFVVRLLFLAALASLLKIFNGNLVAASRCCSLLDVRGSSTPASARAREELTPSVAVLALGGVTAVAACLGDAILVPITEVGLDGLGARLAGRLRGLLLPAAEGPRPGARRDRNDRRGHARPDEGPALRAGPLHRLRVDRPSGLGGHRAGGASIGGHFIFGQSASSTRGPLPEGACQSL